MTNNKINKNIIKKLKKYEYKKNKRKKINKKMIYFLQLHQSTKEICIAT